jgi:tetratricopeptide (TPR) repeat protein
MTAKIPTKVVPHPAASSAALVGAGALCIASAWLVASSNRFPYVWFDVAAVYFLCALPLAQLLTHGLGQRSTSLVVRLGALLLIGLVLTASQSQYVLEFGNEAQWPAIGILVRVGVALLVATSAFVLANWIASIWTLQSGTSTRDTTHDPNPLSASWSYLLLVSSVLSAALVPAAYTQSRRSHFEDKLAEALDQNRLGQAQLLAQQLRELAPRAEFRGRSMRQAATAIDRQVQDVQQRLSQPLADNTIGAMLERARQYAILGEVEQTRRTLQPLVRTQSPHPAACLLLGTAYESREDWRASRGWYEQARAGLLSIGSQPPARPLMVQAIKGIAYTERKLGRYREAEAAYLETLALSPSAETHFLLAQFYEDGQQTAQAQKHAQAAARLDPQRFAAPTKRLIETLTTSHFGCLSAFLQNKTAAVGKLKDAP